MHNRRLRLGTENLQSVNKVLTVFVVAKYFSTFYPRNHYVVQNTWSVLILLLLACHVFDFKLKQCQPNY